MRGQRAGVPMRERSSMRPFGLTYAIIDIR
jgi:hypothetical protein